MKVKFFFDGSESNVSDFDMYLRLLHKVLKVWLELTPFFKMQVDIFKGVSNEAQKEKACNKSVCKQRRNKTVNAS